MVIWPANISTSWPTFTTLCTVIAIATAWTQSKLGAVRKITSGRKSDRGCIKMVRASHHQDFPQLHFLRVICCKQAVSFWWLQLCIPVIVNFHWADPVITPRILASPGDGRPLIISCFLPLWCFFRSKPSRSTNLRVVAELTRSSSAKSQSTPASRYLPDTIELCPLCLSFASTWDVSDSCSTWLPCLLCIVPMGWGLVCSITIHWFCLYQ